jgi:hypothetical protein
MRRAGRYFAIAIAIHFGVVAIATRMPTQRFKALQLRTHAETEFEIAVEREAVLPKAEPAVDTLQTLPVRRAHAEQNTPPSTTDTNANGDANGPVDPAEPFHFSGLTRSAERGALATGEANGAGAAAVDRDNREGVDPGGLRRALLARDTEHGYGNVGAIANAVNTALREVGAPEGSASFEFQIAANGDVRAFLLRASKDEAQFRKLEELLAKRVGASSYKARDRGVRVTVDVKVWQQFVDGTKPEDLGPRAEASMGEATVSKDGVITLTKPPGVILSTRGKMGSIGVYAGPMGVGLAGSVSPENAGSPSRSMTSAKVVSAVTM